MSDLMPSADAIECPAGLASAPVLESYPAHQAALPGGLVVHRALPRAGRRLVGPWCFLDHYGPLAFGAGKPMDIGPHPHIGLPTVTWLIEGEALALLGGEPFGERILMWWNFVARTPEEIAQARTDWERGDRFGSVPAYAGDRIPAPPLTPRVQRSS
jgi:redox-sensitive bicupin YhaK (pirin superfamily)